MGLDKWLNPEEVEKKPEKQQNPIKKEVKRKTPKSQSITPKLMKYTLNCPNSKCKYQKTVMKKVLTDIDKICPRCKKEMKIKPS
jgi:hypothetical protein